MRERIIENKNNFSILIGVTSSLIAWLIIFVIMNKYFTSLNEKMSKKLDEIQKSILTLDFYNNTKKEINKKYDDLCECFKPHDKTTQTILNVLQDKFMTLIKYDRSQLLGRGFYDNLFKEADNIKISGITTHELIKSMCKNNRSLNNLINQLLNRENVSVKILLSHPESNFVKVLDAQEGSNVLSNPVKSRIKKSMDLLENFSKKDEGLLLRGSEIDIALTSASINYIITYAGRRNNPEEDVLLMGILFGHKRGGPLYQISKTQNSELYSDCIKYYDKLFKDSSQSIIFTWSDSMQKTFKRSILMSST